MAELETRTYGPGATIVTEGEHSATAYRVESGFVELTREEPGPRCVFRHVGPGDIFAEAALFQRPELMTARALEPVQVRLIDPEALSDAAFVRDLAATLHDHERLLADFVARVNSETATGDRG